MYFHPATYNKNRQCSWGIQCAHLPYITLFIDCPVIFYLFSLFPISVSYVFIISRAAYHTNLMNIRNKRANQKIQLLSIIMKLYETIPDLYLKFLIISMGSSLLCPHRCTHHPIIWLLIVPKQPLPELCLLNPIPGMSFKTPWGKRLISLTFPTYTYVAF